ncbi:MAG: GAF domain-containing protein, partial [Frankiaceae bacterium]|nr:GAF domain-containing protein [Frankiaceae bacterium]
MAVSAAYGEVRHTALELVAHVAGQLGENLELHQILGEIAHAGRALLDIDRVSIFTLDGDYLRPAVSVSRVADDHQLWATFRTMPPVSLDLSSEARVLLAHGRAVQIDARVSPVVPPEWRRTFALTNLAIVPLRGANSVCGVLIGDSSDPARARLTPEQLHALETVSSLAGLVLERHELAMTSLSQTADLLAVTRALAEADTRAEIATAAAVGLRNVFGAATAVAGLIGEDGGLDVTGHAGEPGADGGAVDWASVTEACLDAYPTSDHVVVGLDEGVTYVGALDGAQLVVAGRLTGVPSADAGCRQRAYLVLDQIRHAIRRHRSQAAESLARQRLGDVTAFAVAATSQGPVAKLVDRLAPPLRTVAHAELLDLVIHPAARARALGLRPPTAAETRRITAWRAASTPPAPVLADGRCAVPLVSDGNVLGAMLLRVTEDTDLDALQHASALIGPVVETALLRRELDEHRQRAEILGDRIRVEAKSRTTALERLETALTLTRAAGAEPARNGMTRAVDVARVQELVRNASLELAGAQSAASWSSRPGLVGKLRALARSIARPEFSVVVRAAAGIGDAEPPHASALVLA